MWFMHQTVEWTTPRDQWEEWNAEFHFTVDVASTHENALCEKHYTIEEDGLTQDWSGEVVWANPPYGPPLAKWVEKAHNEMKLGAVIVMLIPARTDTRWWQKYISGDPSVEVKFLAGRLKFGNSKNSAPFPSALVIFRRLEAS